MSNANEDQGSMGDEISLLDIVNFLQGAWKKLAIAAVVGAVLGFGNWYFLGSYQAEYVLLNNNNNNNNNSNAYIEPFVEQRKLLNVLSVSTSVLKQVGVLYHLT